MKRFRFQAAVVAAFFICSSIESFAVPPPIELVVVATGVSSPVYITNARDSRLFVVEKGGQIRILQGGAFLPTAFLNITTIVRSIENERGLLGLAFHPNYPTTPYFFVHFTSNGVPLPDGTIPALGNNVIVRYTVSADPNVADGTSGKTLMVIPQPFANHNGGMIEFGGDGNLYIGKGDGGSANDPGDRSQNINELLGKMLRIDVDQVIEAPPYYEIPPTNPFAGPVAGRDEIFLVGLRNPWRFSFDRTTGDLWIGDVGQFAIEEIDQIPIDAAAPGKNLGWRVFEGTACTGLDPQKCAGPQAIPHTPPIAEYTHIAGRCSITGGYVYRGTQITGLIGTYVYADYCTGEIWRLLGTTPELLVNSPYNISSFGEDMNGELYVTGLGGEILRINPVSTAATVSVRGRIVDVRGRGVRGVRVSLSGGRLSRPILTRTNAFGHYRFSAEAGETYVLTPTSKRHDFSPASRLINAEDNVSDADFTGVPRRR